MNNIINDINNQLHNDYNTVYVMDIIKKLNVNNQKLISNILKNNDNKLTKKDKQKLIIRLEQITINYQETLQAIKNLIS
jgi:hypothetical protein